MAKNILITIMIILCLLLFVYGYIQKGKIDEYKAKLNECQYTATECGRLFSKYADSVKKEIKDLNIRIKELEKDSVSSSK